MIAVAWADWKDFREHVALFVWGVAGILAAAALVFGSLRPEYLALVIPAVFFVVGWAMGTQRWNTRRAWDWSAESHLSAVSYLSGKILGLLLICGATLAFLSPLIGLVVVVSGVNLPALFWTLAWAVILGLWPLLVATLVTQGPGTLWPFVGLVALVLLLIESAALPELRLASPVMHLWSLYQTGQGSSGALPLAVHAIALVGLGALTTLVYRLNPRFH